MISSISTHKSKNHHRRSSLVFKFIANSKERRIKVRTKVDWKREKLVNHVTCDLMSYDYSTDSNLREPETYTHSESTCSSNQKGHRVINHILVITCSSLSVIGQAR